MLAGQLLAACLHDCPSVQRCWPQVTTWRAACWTAKTRLLAAEHRHLACLGGHPFPKQVQVAVSLCQQGLVSPHVQPTIVQAAT